MSETNLEVNKEVRGDGSKPEHRRKKPCALQKEPNGEPVTEEECESPPTSCSEISTSTGNLLDRIIHDPSSQRKPFLRQWPLTYPKNDELCGNNPHQLKASLKSSQLLQMCFLRVDSLPHTFRRTAIIGTIGPSCTTVDSILDLLHAGVNVFRISVAHINPCDRTSYISNVIEATNKYSTSVDYTIPVGLMMELRGPEIRTGKIEPGCPKKSAVSGISLIKGQTIRLVTDNNFKNRCSEKVIFVDYPALSSHVQHNTEIYVEEDLKLRVECIDNHQIVCKIESDGLLKNYQQVHIPMVPLSLPDITDCDWKYLNIAIEKGVDVIVIPKTRNEKVIRRVKSVLEKKGMLGRILVFGKISNYEGVRNINKIISAADGIVIHRKGLALEIPTSKIFLAQKEITAKCNRAGKPVVCMVELNSGSVDTAQTVIDGADCLMLTAETATMAEGPKNVRLLCEIIREAEAATMSIPFHNDLVDLLTPSMEPSCAIALAAVEVANKIRAAAILTITTSGRTAHLLSWFRPRCPVIAITRIGRVSRQLNMWRAVIPLIYSGALENDWFEDCTSRIRYGISYGKDREIIRSGDALVLVTGYRKNAGFTNCLRVVFASLEQENFVDNIQDYFAKMN